MSSVTAAKQRFSITGNAPALNQAVERALRVAPIDLSVLVTGESGTGKEFFPKIIHQNSPRKHAPYIAVNCGAIPEGTIDSELFGHEKGAFTGAVASRKGYFEEADGGTIFLDEVAELPLTTQARLLRVLENGEFIKVGSSQVQRTNVRIVAATNVDMAAAIARGQFREDLFYRLSTVAIAVPPLRSRGTDIAALTARFAADFSERYLTAPVTFSDEARTLMTHQPWPGNVRQLKNVVEQIALFEAGKEITPEILANYLPESPAALAPAIVASSSHSYEKEREMLFNLIFRLRSEIDDLKAKIDPETDVKPAETAGKLMKITPAPFQFHNSADFAPQTTHHTDETTTDDAETPIDVTPVTMTLDEIERQTIEQSLRRHNGHRKAVAAELNISERTLYRKLKEYGLE